MHVYISPFQEKKKLPSPENLSSNSVSRGCGLRCHLSSSDSSSCSIVQGSLQPLDSRSLSYGTAAACGTTFLPNYSQTLRKKTKQQQTEVFVLATSMWKLKLGGTAALTHSIVLSWQMLLVAHRAHAISPRVAVETTAGGTEHRSWALIGLLSHSDVWWLVRWPTDIKMHTEMMSVGWCHHRK